MFLFTVFFSIIMFSFFRGLCILWGLAVRVWRFIFYFLFHPDGVSELEIGSIIGFPPGVMSVVAAAPLGASATLPSILVVE